MAWHGSMTAIWNSAMTVTRPARKQKPIRRRESGSASKPRTTFVWAIPLTQPCTDPFPDLGLGPAIGALGQPASGLAQAEMTSANSHVGERWGLHYCAETNAGTKREIRGIAAGRHRSGGQLDRSIDRPAVDWPQCPFPMAMGDGLSTPHIDAPTVVRASVKQAHRLAAVGLKLRRDLGDDVEPARCGKVPLSKLRSVLGPLETPHHRTWTPLALVSQHVVSMPLHGHDRIDADVITTPTRYGVQLAAGSRSMLGSPAGLSQLSFAPAAADCNPSRPRCRSPTSTCRQPSLEVCRGRC